FLRKKFNLKLLSSKEFKIPKIIAKITEFPLPINAAYMVSQIGCPNNCNFCPSPYIYRYKPFSNAAKIINYLEKLSNNSNKDIFLYICDPNAFYPFQIWQKVFDYFIKNPKKIDYNIFIFCLSSLNHLNKFNLEKIQKSPLSILFINYGIESAINKYPKNRGNPKKVVERLNNLNIITYQSFIIGFPFHTPELLKLDVMKNLEFNSDIFFINAYKPLPMTPLYNQLKSEERIFGMELPPEFLWVFEYMAFKHPFLGFGFDILKYCFYSYVESEKKTIDIYGKISDKLLNIFAHTNSRKIKRAASIFSKMSQANFFSFQNRMPINLTKIYKKRIEKNIKKIH
ncbi:MAG: B12-binding domain-containing radical SAM protein, partial [Candidatus Hermodarchaeota archaeon]